LLGKQRPSVSVIIRRVVLPFALVGIVTVGAMSYYNYRITGDITRLPYLVHTQKYMMAALFIWQPLPPKPVFRHKILEDFHENFELPYYVEKHSFWGFIKVNLRALLWHLVVFGSILAIPLIGSAASIFSWSRKNYSGRFALCIYAFFIFGIMIETYSLPHYWAPVTALVYFFGLQGIRLWRVRHRGVGQFMVYGVPILSLTILAISTYFLVLTRDDFTGAQQRADLLMRLKEGEDRHLILLKYGPHHSYFMEWVYNDADINASKVVWARAMDIKDDCKLVDYFKDRKVWLLEIDYDEAPIKLKIFPRQMCA
jgi:hypothetical protein